MTLVAQRRLSIGDTAFTPGDIVDAEHQALLPHGRLEVLKRAGMVQDVPGDPDSEGAFSTIAEEIGELRDRVTKLEDRNRGRRPRQNKGGA